MILTPEFINRFEQFGYVTYDLLLKDGEEVKHRFNVKLQVDDDNDSHRAALVEVKKEEIALINRAAFVNNKINILKARLLAGLDAQLEALRTEILNELYGGQ